MYIVIYFRIIFLIYYSNIHGIFAQSILLKKEIAHAILIQKITTSKTYGITRSISSYK